MSHSIQQTCFYFLKQALEERFHIRSGESILAAVSGGVDSSVLLDMLAAQQNRLGYKVYVCHINHGLRQQEALRDERAVTALAESYNLPCTVRRFDSSEIQQVQSGNLENEARQLRYSKLVHTAIELDCAWIATGHTKSDQAETVLHRLFRSTGLAGLRGIHELRSDLEIPVIRPLLSISREMVDQYAQEQGVPFIDDSMNDDPQFTRVRIRKRILPLIQDQLNPKAEEALSRLAKMADDDENFWSEHVQMLKQHVGRAHQESPASRERWLELSKAEQNRLLRAYCVQCGLDPSWNQIESLGCLLRGSRPQGEIHLSEEIRFVRRYDLFYMAHARPLQTSSVEAELIVPGCLMIPELGITVETTLHTAPPHAQNASPGNTAFFDWDRVQEPITVRTRRPGDVIFPLGMQGKKKSKKILQEKQIPLEAREKIPHIFFNGELAWITGICLSRHFSVNAATKRIVKIVVHRLDKPQSP